MSGCQLYRHWSADGELLYVGISLHTMTRLSQHRSYSHWYEDVANVTIERFECRETAMAAEKTAIQDEKPKWNIIHAEKLPKTADEQTVNAYETARQILSINTVMFKPLYTLDEVAERTGLGRGMIRTLIERGEIGVVKHPARTKYKRYLVSGWQLIDFIEKLEQEAQDEQV